MTAGTGVLAVAVVCVSLSIQCVFGKAGCGLWSQGLNLECPNQDVT